VCSSNLSHRNESAQMARRYSLCGTRCVRGDPVLIAPVRDYLGEPLGDAEPTLCLGEQHDAAIRRDRSAIKGSGDFLPLKGWKGERQQIIVGHRGRGAL